MVEVRYRNASKGSVVEEVARWLRDQIASGESAKVDFVLSLGDDRSDEEVFSMVKAWKERAAAESSEFVSLPGSPEACMSVLLSLLCCVISWLPR